MSTFNYELFRNIRTEKQISQKEIADALQTNRSYVSRWENGTDVPTMEQIRKLETLLGVPLYTRDRMEKLKDIRDYLLYPAILIVCSYISMLCNAAPYSVFLSLGMIVFARKQKMSRTWLLFTVGIFLFILLSYMDIRYHCFSMGHVYYRG